MLVHSILATYYCPPDVGAILAISAMDETTEKEQIQTAMKIQIVPFDKCQYYSRNMRCLWVAYRSASVDQRKRRCAAECPSVCDRLMYVPAGATHVIMPSHVPITTHVRPKMESEWKFLCTSWSANCYDASKHH